MAGHTADRTAADRSDTAVAVVVVADRAEPGPAIHSHRFVPPLAAGRAVAAVATSMAMFRGRSMTQIFLPAALPTERAPVRHWH